MNGNTIDIGNGDNAIGIVGLDATVGANAINNNTITGGGRFGIEIKNPAGGVTISGNSVTLTTQNADARDRAGIAVFRRSKLAVNVDVPNGVTVTGNTVTGYQQSSTSEGFGIVIEGTNHSVTGNTLTNNDVGILQQQNPSNYPGDANQNDVADQYFGRGNSPITCGNTISGNTFSGNATDTRNIGVGGGLVTNTNTTEQFCSIQAAIDDADTQNGHTIVVAAGTYVENLLVKKALTIKGAGRDLTFVHAATPTYTLHIDGNAAPVLSGNVSIEGFTFADPNRLHWSVVATDHIASGLQLTFKNNRVTNGNRYGWWDYHSHGSLLCENNIFSDVYYGMLLEGWDTGTLTIQNNEFTNLHLYIDNMGNPVPANGGPVGILAMTYSPNGVNCTNPYRIYENHFHTYAIDGSGIVFNGGLTGIGAAKFTDVEIARNTISPGATSGTGIRLRNLPSPNNNPGGGVHNALIHNNFISNAQYGIRLQGDNPGTQAHENSIINCSSLGIENTGTAVLNATCNWYGVTGASVPPLISGSVTFEPFLTNGADNDAGTKGFQPVPNSCSGCAGGGSVQNTTTGEYFCTIQAAIDDAQTLNGHTLTVAAGTYNENITINKSLTINGPNAAVNACNGVRVAEAIIRPATSQPYYDGATEVSMIKIEAPNVTIKGFTLDGDNPALTSTAIANGANIDAADAIVVYADVSGTVVENNIIKNYNESGFSGYPSGSTPIIDNKVNNNKFDNMAGIVGMGYPLSGYGLAVLIYNNFYTQVDNNCITNARIGVQTGNYHLANTGSVLPSITSNAIQSTAVGIFHNLHYSNASPFSIKTNTLTSLGGVNRGLLVWSMQQTTSAIIEGNNITGGASGIEMWNNPTSNTIKIKGGSISGAAVGVKATNYDNTYGAGETTVGILEGVTIQNSTTRGIWVEDNASGTKAIVLTLQNNTVVNNSGTGALVDRPLATLNTGASSHNATFSNNTTVGILAQNGANVSVSQSSFTGNAAGVNNSNAGGTPAVNATLNWWGSNTGPGGSAPGSGNTVTSGVIWCPFLNTAPPAGVSTKPTVSIVVTESPVSGVATDGVICQGGSVSLNATTTGATGYLWAPGGETTASLSGLNATNSYTVTVSFPGCTVDKSQAVTVNPTPAAPVSSGATICFGGSTTLTATGCTGSGFVLKWYKASDNSLASMPVSPSANTDYYSKCEQTANNTTCPSAASNTVTVTVLNPSAPVSSGATICFGGSTTLTATGCTGSGFVLKWYKASDNSLASMPVSPSVSTDYYSKCEQTANNTTCPSAASNTVTVTVLNPSAPVSSGATICFGGSTTLTATGCTGSGFVLKWYKASDNSLANMPVSPSANTDYYSKCEQTANNTTCPSAASNTVTVTVLNPSAPVSSGATICFGGSTTLTATGCTGSGFVLKWYKASDNSLANMPVSPSANTDYYSKCEQTANNTTCPSAASNTVTVTVNPLPTASISTTPTAVCQNAPFPTVTFTGSGGTAPYTFTYKINGGADLTIISSGNTAAISQTTAMAGVFEYTLVSVKDASSTQCSQTQNGTATITVHALPSLGTTPASLCTGQSFTLSPTTGGSWVSSNPSIASVNIPNPGVVKGIVAGVVFFTFTETATGCSSTTANVTIKPTPSSNLEASKYDVCPNTEVTLTPNCSVPTSTLSWNPGAPTVTPDAATVPYIYRVKCVADGCEGNESSVEVRTHRILVDMKDLDVGALPLPIVRAVKDNMAPTNQITAPVFPRRWTFIANGCSFSESAEFKLSGPVNFNTVDNASTYAMFANDGGGFYSLDHPNYGNGGSFPNGTYSLTINLRDKDGVGGPFPKNRVPVGSLLATRTLEFTVGPLLGGRQGVSELGAELKEDNWINLGQNPVSDEILVRLSGKVGEEIGLSLVNMQGQSIQQRSLKLSSVEQAEVLNMRNTGSGLYILQAIKGDKVKTIKVVKVD